MKNDELIMKALDDLFPEAHCELDHRNHFQLLIAVVLSAQTTDKRVNSVTPELFDRYPDAKSLSKAKLEDVEEIIRPIGLYHSKAVNIIRLADILCLRFDGEVPSAREDLESLPGVGRKTANVILNNCFDVPAFAVDTHVSRVAKRLKIADPDDDVTVIEKKLMNYFPEEKWGKLHHQFIFFGRYRCKAARPECADCPLQSICDHFA